MKKCLTYQRDEGREGRTKGEERKERNGEKEEMCEVLHLEEGGKEERNRAWRRKGEELGRKKGRRRKE